MVKKISILGLGNVGKAIASLLLTHPHQLCINIMDPDTSVVGAYLDLQHACELYPQITLSLNNQEAFKDADYIFHCAGASIPKGQSRTDVIQLSKVINKSIFENYHPNKTPFIIVVANPVDFISYDTQKLTGLPPQNIVGTGTYLDSLRYNHLIAKDRPNITDLNSIVLGEHGTTAFISNSLSTLNNQALSAHLSAKEIDYYLSEMKDAAKQIKATQDATIYGVSHCAIQIFQMLLQSEKKTIPLSAKIPSSLVSRLGAKDIYLSVLCEINKEGVFAIEDIYDEEDILFLNRSFQFLYANQ